MREKKIREIEKKLEVFGFGKLQDLITLYSVLQRENITFVELKKYVEKTKKINLKVITERKKVFERMKEKWERKGKRCPVCAGSLFLRAVNIPKGKANRKGYTCHWFCPKEDCPFEEYTYEDSQEIYRKIMED